MRIFCGVAIASCALVLSGCSGVVSTTSTTTTSTDPVKGTAVKGQVYGGRQAIVGASVYLYAANTTGYGSASTPLLNTPVTTDSAGNFTITGDYTCPSTASQVYLYAVGGNAGGGANTAAGLMAALGTCPANGTLSSALTVNVDEVSTIATAYAIAGYATDATHVSSSGTTLAKTGIANAFATVANLETLSTGVALATTPAGNGTVPQSKINTLADILAACVNSSGPSSTQCSTLLSNAKNGSTVPTETATAAINIAHNPGANVAALYSVLPGSGAPWQPTLSAAPNDFLISVKYTGGGMSSPTAVSVNAAGNVWVANYGNSFGSAVSEFTPNGAATAFPSGITGNGLNESYGMALDVSGNVWVTNYETSYSSGSGDVTKLNASGSAVATGVTGGGIDYPVGVAADSNGNMWFTNYGNASVTLLNSAGTAISPSSGWGGTSLDFPVALAIDSSHNAWVASQSNSTSISKISSDGTTVTNYNCGCNGASGLALDGSSNVWVANYYGDSVSEVTSGGTVLVNALKGGGVSHPQGIAADGNGTVWLANHLGNTISEVNGSTGTLVSPSTGFGTDAALSQPFALAIDGSGNIWVTNFAISTLTEFVGAAAPVKTPLSGPAQLP